MSNHSGSYMLNEVLLLMEQRGVFTLLELPRTQELVLEMIRISKSYDCNQGEILDEIGERLGICYYCLSPSTDLDNGVCERYRTEWEKPSTGRISDTGDRNNG
ncbi:MAG TPA: hypothetical protein VKU00_05795 [Chthonomonadaceae bacterium]|nr:hypothetical protein [Chthonomonadaceae bacterium]